MHLVLVEYYRESIPNYPSLTRTTNLDGINDQSFTIDQFRDIRIDQVDGSLKLVEYQFDNGVAFNTSINVTTRRDTNIW